MYTLILQVLHQNTTYIIVDLQTFHPTIITWYCYQPKQVSLWRTLLGHHIDCLGISPLPEKVQIVHNFPQPQCVCVCVCRKNIHNFAFVAPL